MTKSSKYHWLLAMTPFQRSYIQGLTGKPGNAREFNRCQGNVSGKMLPGKTVSSAAELICLLHDNKHSLSAMLNDESLIYI